MNTHVIIMAGGKGSRMRSKLPKVLHTIAGETLIRRVLNAVQSIDNSPTIIVGYKAEEVIRSTGEEHHYVFQEEQLGTGHAVSLALKQLDGRAIDRLVVVPGDHPLLSAETLLELVATYAETEATIVLGTIKVPDFEDWRASFVEMGRVVRDEDGNVLRLVERKDASPTELAVTELNVSFYCFNFAWLCEYINELSNANAAKEYYLTDLIGIAKKQGKKVMAVTITRTEEGFGVNSPEQLAYVEAYLLKMQS
ncbi:MAG: NTP transferase domain-containing protein [Patescibacteria group bacterium]